MQEHILIIGNGGREYAMGLALSQDKRVQKLYFAPGNGATTRLGVNLVSKTPQEIVDSVQKLGITLVIIGPEAPLSEGLSDFLRTHHIRVFGPSQQAAQLESSKAFMKDFVAKIQVPTAKYIQSDDRHLIESFIDTLTPPIVVKADGLCAGKGVIIAQTHQEAKETAYKMLEGESFGDAGKRVVVEEFLEGYELSVFAVCDGEDFVMLSACQDHKRLLSGDKGPNTGGMGAYTPTPLCDEKLMQKIKTRIISPTLQALKEQGMPFEGVLFGGIMVVEKNGEKEPYLLEYNVRFGDPECEVLMPLLQTPLLDMITATLDRTIKNLALKISENYAVAVVVASKDYPYHSSAPALIHINDFDATLGHLVFAGVGNDKEGHLLATGGRVLLAVGIAPSIKRARDNAYKILENVKFEGMQFRNDIAFRAL